MIQATIFEAKTNLSRLVKRAQKGEVVVITAGRKKAPVAQLIAVNAAEKKRLGILETPGFVLPESFFDPLPEQELGAWEGNGE
jgi:antitoxin (DNA-binding transcriptional repressor) of toxin-antitoxin stability system